MNNPFFRKMQTATDLTRSGRLHEATALIQSLMGRQEAAPAPASPETSPPLIAPDGAIEGEFTRLDTDPDPTADAPPEAAPRGLKAARKAAKPRGKLAKDVKQTLAQTLGRIAAGGMPARGPLAPAAPEVPEGARFLSLTHTSAEGSRDYRLYIPARRPAGLMPLVVMLHGCTQSPEDFALGTGMNALAEEFGCIVAWPAQPNGANMQKCWNWFRPQDQGRQGEPALIAGITRDILRDHPADPARVYVAGLSAGGGAAAIVAAAWPEVFSAAGVHSGLPVGGASDVPSAFAAMRNGSTGARGVAGLPTIVFHGAADSTVHPSNGLAVIDQALRGRRGLRRRVSTEAGARQVTRTDHVAPDGRTMAEHWEIAGAGHAWSGGQAAGSYTDPLGPDASRQMLRFFLQHARG